MSPMTMPPMAPGLWQYLDVIFENNQAKIRSPAVAGVYKKTIGHVSTKVW